MEELVETLENPADLRSIYATEEGEGGKQRVGVFNAVRFRLAALEDAASQTDSGDGAEGAEGGDSAEGEATE